MEKFETPERIPEKLEIIERLKRDGMTTENEKLVTRWVIEREKLVQTPRDTVVLNIEIIDFYEAVGNDADTKEAVKQAYENARRENEDDLIEQLLQRFPELVSVRLE